VREEKDKCDSVYMVYNNIYDLN